MKHVIEDCQRLAENKNGKCLSTFYKDNKQKTKKLDQRKNKLISEHSEDVKIFIRIPYWEPITEENAKRLLGSIII